MLRRAHLVLPATALALAALASSAHAASAVTVRPGDTVSGIAAREGVSASALARHNGIADPSLLRAGQVLRVPRAWTAYRVRPGDSLGAIAARHGTSVVALARRNRIAEPSRLRAGRRILVPARRARARPARQRSPAKGAQHAKPRVPAGWVRYRVRPGDSLGVIAIRRRTSSGALARANRIRNPSDIRAGQIIRVPPAATARRRAAWARYRVRPGESLGVIASRRGTSSAALAARNGIDDPSLIRVGQIIRVPRGTPGPAGRADGGLPPVTTTRHAAGRTRAEVVRTINRMAARYGVDPRLARAVSWQESGYQQSVVSSTGAIGVMQLMPETARWLGHDVVRRPLNPHRLVDNVEGGVAYLAWLLDRTSRRHAIAGYYQGLRSISERGMFRDTRRYVRNVEALMGRI